MTKLKKNIVKKAVKKKVGRKSLTPFLMERKEKILKMIELGYTKEEIIKRLNIGRTTYFRFQNGNTDFWNATYDAQLDSGIESKNSLHKRAIGYDVTEEVVEYSPDRKGEMKIKNVKKMKKHIPASVEALRFELMNKFPEIYKEKKDTNITIIDLNKAKKEIENIFE